MSIMITLLSMLGGIMLITVAVLLVAAAVTLGVLLGFVERRFSLV